MPSAAYQTQKDEFLSNLPKLHVWSGVEALGGFESFLPKMEEMVSSLGNPEDLVAYETGAGLSSIWLLMLGVRLHSFFLEKDLGERIEAYMAVNAPAQLGNWTAHTGFSEEILPLHALRHQDPIADFALVDGGHGLTTAVIDLVYLNYLLKPGGLLVVDDLQLAPCRLIHDLAVNDGGFAVKEYVGKTGYLLKKSGKRMLGDSGGQKKFWERLAGAFEPLPGQK